MSTLLDKCNAIKLDKEANLKPGNLRAGITCLGVTGTMTSGESGVGINTIIPTGTNRKFIELITSISDLPITFTGGQAASFFMSLSKLERADLSAFNTAGATSFKDMFKNCQSLKTVNFGELNTSNVLTCEAMFYGCSAIDNLDFSGFDTSKVTTMRDMFRNCSNLKTIDVSSLSVEKVTAMNYMFDSCRALERLDLSSFVVAPTQSPVVYDMFWHCDSLKYLDICNFSFDSVQQETGTFLNVPADCKIYVKDATAYLWVMTNRPDFTNVHIKGLPDSELPVIPEPEPETPEDGGGEDDLPLG